MTERTRTSEPSHATEHSAPTERSPGHVGTQGDVVLQRVGAFLLDQFVGTVLAVLAAVGVGVALGPGRATLGVMYLVTALGYAGYFVVLEGLYGQTPGKRLLGVVVVSTDGAPITMRQSLARNLLRAIDGIGGYALGLVVMLVGKNYQRLGDLWAETLVVRARR